MPSGDSGDRYGSERAGEINRGERIRTSFIHARSCADNFAEIVSAGVPRARLFDNWRVAPVRLQRGFALAAILRLISAYYEGRIVRISACRL